jgi:uncharacterized protein
MSWEIVILCTAALAAGFIDAIAGGGGLVQTPATLITLPQYDVATLLGTTKIPSFFGTSTAALQYGRRVVLSTKILGWMCLIAFVASFLGAFTVTHVSNRFMKPVMFVMLILVAIYTYTKKDFGTATERNFSEKVKLKYGLLIALLIGFYDGFIGPGAGSFLLVAFISVLGFDFLRASAHAKFVNVATNLGSILLFASQGHVLYHFALPMAVCNLVGAALGARLAILKGNSFIRIFFLIVIAGTIIRFGYDVFWK